MKQLLILLSAIITLSCSEKKQKKAGIDDFGDDIYKLLIHEIVEYNNFYIKDSLLIKTELVYYREALPKKREVRLFEYNENNQLISEEYFLVKGNSEELIYKREVGNNMEKIIHFENNDTLHIDQYKYGNNGLLLSFKTKTNMGLARCDDEYIYQDYDDQGRIILKKMIDYLNGDTTFLQYKYEMCGDTLVKYCYDALKDELMWYEKTLKSTNSDIQEIYSYSSDSTLDDTEKVLKIDDEYSLKTSNYSSSADTILYKNGKEVKSINISGRLYNLKLYEYDNFGNRTKETRYSKVLKE